MDETPRLFANTLAVFETLEKLVRRLLSRAEPPDDEPREKAAAESPVSSVDESPSQEIVDTAAPAALSAGAADVAGAIVEEASPVEEPPVPEPAAPPPPPPRFAMRVLWTPKGGNADSEWEDGYAADAAGGVVAVADGAGDGIFSKLWADLLLESFVARPIALDDPAAVEPWIQDRRKAWFAAIRYPEQRWSIQAKIDRSCGAATFVALKLDDTPDGSGELPESTGWTAWAVGDACLFHIRDDRLIAAFPMVASADFNTTPQLYQSKPLRATPMAVVARGDVRPDDQIVLATDALAQRLLAEIESGSPPDWRRFWDVDQDVWRDEIAALRQQNAIVNDDCTLLILRLTGEPLAAAGAAETTATEEACGAVPADEDRGETTDPAIAVSGPERASGSGSTAEAAPEGQQRGPAPIEEVHAETAVPVVDLTAPESENRLESATEADSPTEEEAEASRQDSDRAETEPEGLPEDGHDSP